MPTILKDELQFNCFLRADKLYGLYNNCHVLLSTDSCWKRVLTFSSFYAANQSTVIFSMFDGEGALLLMFTPSLASEGQPYSHPRSLLYRR